MRFKQIRQQGGAAIVTIPGSILKTLNLINCESLFERTEPLLVYA